MRISDWSSDVCSSDLLPGGHTSHMLGDRRQKIGQRPGLGEIDTRPASFIVQMGIREAGRDKAALQVDDLRLRAAMRPYRTEVRRVGNGCVSPGSSRLSPYH